MTKSGHLLSLVSWNIAGIYKLRTNLELQEFISSYKYHLFSGNLGKGRTGTKKTLPLKTAVKM